MKHEQGYTDGGANPHYDGLFDGETDADKERRIQWAINEDQLPWPGIALEPDMVGLPDFPGGEVVTISPGNTAHLTRVLKCENCGHSITD